MLHTHTHARCIHTDHCRHLEVENEKHFPLGVCDTMFADGELCLTDCLLLLWSCSCDWLAGTPLSCGEVTAWRNSTKWQNSPTIFDSGYRPVVNLKNKCLLGGIYQRRQSKSTASARKCIGIPARLDITLMEKNLDQAKFNFILDPTNRTLALLVRYSSHATVPPPFKVFSVVSHYIFPLLRTCTELHSEQKIKLAMWYGYFDELMGTCPLVQKMYRRYRYRTDVTVRFHQVGFGIFCILCSYCTTCAFICGGFKSSPPIQEETNHVQEKWRFCPPLNYYFFYFAPQWIRTTKIFKKI